MSNRFPLPTKPAEWTAAKERTLMRFLLVEDDEDHAHLIMHHLRQSDSRNVVHHVADGCQALAYLQGAHPYEQAPRPDVILLDLKLPKVDGHEVLDRLKRDPQLRLIPVVVLTTSDAKSDRVRAYRAHANSYLVKPLDARRFRELVEMVSRYWRDWNQPHGDPP
jgi:CheY-like chemotaxis protein